MSRTLDATLPFPNGKTLFHTQDIYDANLNHCAAKLPRPFQTLPPSCQSLPETVLFQIQYLTSRGGNNGNSHNDHDGSSGNISLSSHEEDALDDGFILCDLKTIQRKLIAWYKLFPRIKPFFALKCNPDHMVAHTLGLSSACGFDCASISEIRLALASTGGDARRCVYANPQRARDDLEKSMDLGIGAMTFDGVEELHKIQDAHEKLLQKVRLQREENKEEGDNEDDMMVMMPLAPQMILRIVVPDRHSTVPLGEKFGAPPDKVEMLAEEAMKLGLDVIGVSFHCGSGCHDAEAYGAAIRIAKDAMDVINGVIGRWNEMDGKGRSVCTVLDIGGGYPGMDGVGGDWHRFTAKQHDLVQPESIIEKEGEKQEEEGHDTLVESPSEETAKNIAALVTPLIDELFPVDKTPVQVISEPGRYFVEAAFAYCARIYSAKEDTESGERHYFIAQGVHGLFKDILLCDESFIPVPLMVRGDEATGNVCLDDTRSEEDLYDSVVHGPSGEKFDLVCKSCKLPKLQVGDWLIFDRMGAYTLSIAARNSSLPVRYVLGGGDETTTAEVETA